MLALPSCPLREQSGLRQVRVDSLLRFAIPYPSSNVARFGHNRGHWPMSAFGPSLDVSWHNLNVRF